MSRKSADYVLAFPHRDRQRLVVELADMRLVERAEPLEDRASRRAMDGFDTNARHDLDGSAQCDVHRAFRQLLPEAALIELGDDRPLELVALVEEGEPEREADVLEDVG